jgi:hypothetical protein
MARFIQQSSFVGRNFSFKINLDGSINPPPPGEFPLLGLKTYDATALPAVKSISDIEQYSAQIPVGSGYLRYNLKRASVLGGNKIITVPFYKNVDGKLCQSAFSLTDTNQFLSNQTSIFNYENDDHDTLTMRADGTGILSTSNAYSWANNDSYSIFRGSSEISNFASFSSQFGSSVESFVSGYQAHLVSFPQSGAELWIRFADRAMLLSGFSVETPTELFTYPLPVDAANSIWSISDGVNCMLIGSWSQNTALYIELDLTTGRIYKSQTIDYTPGYQYNPTEQDANGTALFAVNAKNAFHADGSFRYETLDDNYSVGWRFAGGMTANGMQSISIGNSTQSDMDIFGSIDTNGNIWFADWGHDDGGLFGFGNDNTLGIAKTKIRLVAPSDIDGGSTSVTPDPPPSPESLIVFNESTGPNSTVTGGWNSYITGGYGSPVVSTENGQLTVSAPWWQDAQVEPSNNIALSGATSITLVVSSFANNPSYYYSNFSYPQADGQYAGVAIANPSDYNFTNRTVTIPLTNPANGKLRLGVTNSGNSAEDGWTRLHSIVVNY